VAATEVGVEPNEFTVALDANATEIPVVASCTAGTSATEMALAIPSGAPGSNPGPGAATPSEEKQLITGSAASEPDPAAVPDDVESTQLYDEAVVGDAPLVAVDDVVVPAAAGTVSDARTTWATAAGAEA